MKIIELLKERTSVRKFSVEKIPQQVITEVLNAGRLSPSGGNEQPWLFGVISNKESINKISELSYNQKWIMSAPLLVVLCTKTYSKDMGGRNIQIKRFPHLKTEIIYMEDNLYASLNSEEHQTKIAGTHMSLCALEHGVYSTWISYFDVNKVSELLKLPNNCLASEIIAFGYPNETPRVKVKREIGETVFYEVYSK